MTLTLVADEFGLLHAAVPHPCQPQKNIQVMVLEAEDGWWAYVDGERIAGNYASAQNAGRAVVQAIEGLKTLATEAEAGRRLSEEYLAQSPMYPPPVLTRRRTPARFTLRDIAACIATATVVAATGVAYATGALDVGSNAKELSADKSTVKFAVGPRTKRADVLFAAHGEVADLGDATEAEPYYAPVLKHTSAAAAHIDAARATQSDNIESVPGRVTSIAPLPDAEPLPTVADQQDVTDLMQGNIAVTRVSPVEITTPPARLNADAAFVAPPPPDSDDRSLYEFESTRRTAAIGRSLPDATAPRTFKKAKRTVNSLPRKSRRARNARRTARSLSSRRRIKRRRIASFRSVRRRSAKRYRRYSRSAIRRSRQRKFKRIYRSVFAKQ